MICVAPVSGGDVLLHPRAIAEDVRACYERGACMVHLHVRDLNGHLTPDLSLLEETVRRIQDACDIVVEISTGGVSDLTIQQRIQPLYAPWVECVSLNVGSVNLGEAVYQNPIADVRVCVQEIVRQHKVPETELFEVGMAKTLRELADTYQIPKPLLVALVFGHAGEMPATKAGLKHLVSALYENFDPKDVIWGYTQANRGDWEMVRYALSCGAQTLRLGFEDSNVLDPGVRTDANADLIARAAEIVRSMGMEPMRAAECRKLLSLPPFGKGDRG